MLDGSRTCGARARIAICAAASVLLLACGDVHVRTEGDVGEGAAARDASLAPDSSAPLDGGVAMAEDAASTPPLDAGSPGMDAGPPATPDAGPPDAGTPDAGPPAVPCPRVRVTTDTLNVRPTASTSGAPIGSITRGFVATVLATARGESIGGVDLWYKVRSPAGDGYVFSTFVECTEAAATPVDDGYKLPLACGRSARVSQGNGGSTSHQGITLYAFDFAVPLNTPIHASRGGTVLAVKNDTRPGHRCYNGGGRDCVNDANYVYVRHADGSVTAYRHLNETRVSVGATVTRGQLVGLSGQTGYATGPHLHFERRENCGAVFCQTIRTTFLDVPGGVPATGSTVTSGNCP